MIEQVALTENIATTKTKKKSLKKAIRFFVILAFIASVIVVAWRWYTSSQKGAANSGPATATVIRRDFSSTVLATGAVKPQIGAEVKVGARISGKVARLFANIGDRVRQGQVIAELEKADLEAAVRHREADLNLAKAKLSAIENLGPREIQKAEAGVVQWEATWALDKKELARQEELVESEVASLQARDLAKEKFLVSEAQLVSARKTLDLVKTQFTESHRQARTDIEGTEAAMANARVQLSYATLTAPIGGVVGSVSTQEGETVAAGLNAPTFVTIIDLDRLQVDAFVDEVDIGKVQIGQKAVFTVDTFPAREFEGEVVAIYPKAVIQENVVNYDVVVGVTSAYHDLLRPEMTASVTILLEGRRGALAVPTQAVKRERGKNIVYLAGTGQAKLQEVKIGWKDNQWVEILSGLEEGQTVLLNAPAPGKEKEGNK
jgi:multidrug efflux pump subunit AcrA (membrane-fusion protein)